MIAATPEPPYYVVMFTSLRTEVDAGYAEAAQRMLGWTSDEALGQSVRMFVDPAYADSPDRYLPRDLARGEARQVQRVTAEDMKVLPPGANPLKLLAGPADASSAS